MKEALEIFMQESLDEDREKEDERANFTDDDWENFYIDKDLAEIANKLGYLNEYGEYKTQETEYRQELDSMFGDYRPFICLGKYAGDRPDSDPLKGKGFGEVSFNIRDILPEDEWKKALDWVKSKGFEIKSESNDYEMEFDGDRAWYPTIKFHFNADKFDTEELSEFRRTGRQYKAQGQGGSAGNRRPGIMRGPDIEDRDDEEYTSKGDPNIDKGDFYDYSPYGFTIRFLGYEDGDDVIVRGNGFFSEKVKNGKVTFKSYPMKDAQGNRLEDAQGNRPGTPNSAYKLPDNYDESNIVDVLGNDHPFVVMTKSNHWKNNHSIDIDDNSISITLDTPNNLPRGLAPLSESKEKQKIREFIRKSIKKLI